MVEESRHGSAVERDHRQHRRRRSERRLQSRQQQIHFVLRSTLQLKYFRELHDAVDLMEQGCVMGAARLDHWSLCVLCERITYYGSGCSEQPESTVASQCRGRLIVCQPSPGSTSIYT